VASVAHERSPVDEELPLSGGASKDTRFGRWSASIDELSAAGPSTSCTELESIGAPVLLKHHVRVDDRRDFLMGLILAGSDEGIVLAQEVILALRRIVLLLVAHESKLLARRGVASLTSLIDS
jgi:hypothetical protein